MDYIVDLVVKNYQIIVPVVLLVISESIGESKMEENSILGVVVKILKTLAPKKK